MLSDSSALHISGTLGSDSYLDTKGKTYKAKEPEFKAVVWDGKQETVEELQKYLDDSALRVNFKRGEFELEFCPQGVSNIFKTVFKGDVFVFDDVYVPAKGSFGFFCMKPEAFLKNYREVTND